MAEESYNDDSQEHILELVLPFLPARDVFHVTLVSRHFASKNNDLTIGRLLYERTIQIYQKVDSILPTTDENGGSSSSSSLSLSDHLWQLPPKFVLPYSKKEVMQDPRDKLMFDSWSYKEKARSIVAYRIRFKRFYDSLPKPPVMDWLVDDDDNNVGAEEVERRVWHHFAQELAISQAPLRLMNDHHSLVVALSPIPWNLSDIDNDEKRRDPFAIVVYCVCQLYGMHLYTTLIQQHQMIQDDLDHHEAAHYGPWLVPRILASIAAVAILLVFSWVVLQQA